MKRTLEKNLEDNLKKTELWANKIKKDCRVQKIFLAIRKNNIDLYHKGGLLFNFDYNGFKTHIKYASVMMSGTDIEKNYISEDDLANYKIISDFRTNYKRIKENCSKYSGVEAKGISELYHKHSYMSDSNVVVLDIEISFKSFIKGRKQDRIDILLYNKAKQSLQFVEAKHYSNGEIWSTQTPQVINQLKRYEDQIEKREDEILKEYSKYIISLNRIFSSTMLEPKTINKKVILLIFGFDNNQKDGRLKDLIVKNPKYSGIKTYSIGEIESINTENLWKTKELRI